MKLSAAQVEAIERKTGFKPLPEEAAEQSGLAGAFGDQTFYVDPNGVYVFEPIESPSGEGEPMMAIQIAEVEQAGPGDGEAASPAAGDGGNGDARAGEVILRAVQPRATSLTVDLAG